MGLHDYPCLSACTFNGNSINQFPAVGITIKNKSVAC
jgi:hypothetical protein